MLLQPRQSEKRKHKTLTIVEKGEIIKKLDEGENIKDLVSFYGIGRATIYDIKNNRVKIERFLQNNFISKKNGDFKVMKTGGFPLVEEALYKWFLQERGKNTHVISGDLIKQKAKFFFKEIMKKGDFRASAGWLDKFKKRFGIRLLTTTGEKLSSNSKPVERYKEQFKKIVQDLNLDPDQVYNVQESGLFWRDLPKKMFCQKDEADRSVRMSKDRITFITCSNASGNHKLELFVIGKCKNLTNLPVKYKYQNKGWITKKLFTEWFQEQFVPSVEKFLKKKNLPKKVLLLLDNHPGYPDEGELKSNEVVIKIMFLSPNVTPYLLQPMDENVKIHYKRSLLFNIISKGKQNIIQSLKNLNIKDVLFNLARGWENVTTKMLICAWAKIWPDLRPLLFQYGNVENDFDSVADVEIKISTNDLFVDDVNDWLFGKEENCQLMTDDEIIQDVLTITDGNSDDEEEETETFPNVNIPTVRHCDAVSAFSTCVKWAEENNVEVGDVLLLRRLMEKAIKTSLLAENQVQIDNVIVKSETR